jgi:hypothetical protein
MRNASKTLVGKPQEKISLGRPRLKWDDDIEISLRGIVSKVMD